MCFVRRARLPVHAADSSPEWSVTSCHRFSPRRVDCRTDYSPDVGLAPYYCDSIDAIMLRPSGRVVTRGYDCPVRRGEPDFKRHPRWVGRSGAVDLRPLVSR